MNNLNEKKHQTEISIIGNGIAGITTAYHLGEKGYKVNLIDPNINSEITNLNPNNGTQASLGLLMGNINKRSKGRAFLLRNRSMKLWKEWLIKINELNSSIRFEKPLIKLADSEREYQSMIEISKNKKEFKIELLDKKLIDFWSSIFEKKIIGGLISHEDGRLNPIELMKSLKQKLGKMKINLIEDNVIRIKRDISSFNKQWKISLESNESIKQDYIVICSALNTEKLLKPLGHTILLEPVLGQIVELELNNNTTNWNQWPAILNYQSINFIHHNHNHILIGATIERGTKPSLLDKLNMLNMCDSAPDWITKARICHEWHGIRARPTNEPAPLLKELEPRLLINTGHYRNGILLAPYCAEWIGHKIDQK
tara:strand:+ start:301 stop:1407 length:1107 start_codon:yes stop_codon:yes gene_type:complete